MYQSPVGLVWLLSRLLRRIEGRQDNVSKVVSAKSIGIKISDDEYHDVFQQMITQTYLEADKLLVTSELLTIIGPKDDTGLFKFQTAWMKHAQPGLKHALALMEEKGRQLSSAHPDQFPIVVFITYLGWRYSIEAYSQNSPPDVIHIGSRTIDGRSGYSFMDVQFENEGLRITKVGEPFFGEPDPLPYSSLCLRSFISGYLHAQGVDLL